jgi:hypothetical protein
MKRTPVIITLAGMAALAVTGTALAATQDDNPTPSSGIGTSASDDPTALPTPDDSASPADPTPSDSATNTTAPMGANITAAEARKIALTKAGGGTVTKIESELEHGFSTWKIEVVTGGVAHDIYVDRATGAIIKTDTDAARTSTNGTATRRSDDPATHDAGDDKGGLRGGNGADDPAGHDAGDDKGGDRGGHGADDPAGHDAGDDKGGDHGGHGGHGSDDHGGRH